MTKRVFFVLALMLIASSALCAQTTSAAGASDKWAIYIGAGFAMAIASGLCGLAQGKAIAACAEAMARNPGAAGNIRFALILGLALIESLALYTLVIVMMKVG